jgi:hypothetical protein
LSSKEKQLQLFNKPEVWVNMVIYLNEITYGKINEVIVGYYNNLYDLFHYNPEEWDLIIAECFFEHESGLY